MSKTKHVSVDGNYAYVSMHEGLGGFVIVDITDPADPEYVGHAASSASVNATIVDGNYAYAIRNATGGPGGIEVWDITDKSAPVKVGEDGTTGQLFDADKVGDYVYAAGAAGDGLVVYDVSNPASPLMANKIPFGAGGIRVSGDTVFVTDYSNAKLQAYDIGADPSTPAFIAEISVGAFPVPDTIQGDYIFVEEYNGTSIHLIDISNPAAMQLLSTFSVTEGFLLNQGSVIPRGDRLSVITTEALHVFNIENKTAPVLLGTDTFPSTQVQSVEGAGNFKDGYLILADRTPDRLLILDTPTDTTWYTHPAGTYEPGDFDDPTNVKDWRNADLAEVWIRAVIEGATGDTEITLKGRPRVEMVVNGY